LAKFFGFVEISRRTGWLDSYRAENLLNVGRGFIPRRKKICRQGVKPCPTKKIGLDVARFYTAPMKNLSAGYKTLPYKGNWAQCRARFHTAPKKKFVGRV